MKLPEAMPLWIAKVPPERQAVAKGAPLRTLNSLQAGRAIAALMVVVHHANVATAAFVAPVPTGAASIFDLGYLGVDFFFVLSGFIIYYTTVNLEPTAANTATFARKRLTRIFVPYWPIGIGLALAYSVMPGLSASNRSWGWFATLTLLPSWNPPALSVAWTLQHELVFYALFGAMFYARAILPLTVVWTAAILSAAVLQVGLDGPLKFLLAPINLEFIMGIATAFLVRSGRKLPAVLLTCGIIAPLGAFFALGATRDISPLVGLAVAFVVFVVCRMEMEGRLSIAVIFVLLGDASYAIYLIHNPLLSLFLRLIAGIPQIEAWSVAILLAVVLCTLAGLAYHLIYERRALRAIRAMARPRLVSATGGR